MTPSPSRTSAAVLAASILVSLLAAACGGGGGGGGGGAASPTPSPTAGGGASSADPSASGQASGAVASPAASGGGGSSSGSKTPPDDACSVISDTDVKEIFGGNVEPVPNDDDDDNSCSFSVTDGNGLLQDYAATTPQIVAITFDEGWIGYDEEHTAMGDAVAKVEGLGRDAWIGLGAIHVDLGDDNEMVANTVFGAIYDPTVIEGERYALAKLVLSRL